MDGETELDACRKAPTGGADFINAFCFPPSRSSIGARLPPKAETTCRGCITSVSTVRGIVVELLLSWYVGAVAAAAAATAAFDIATGANKGAGGTATIGAAPSVSVMLSYPFATGSTIDEDNPSGIIE
jgi:hypothetical protein